MKGNIVMNEKVHFKKSCNCKSNKFTSTMEVRRFERWTLDEYGNKIELEEEEFESTNTTDDPKSPYFSCNIYCSECGEPAIVLPID
jgi:hypothetical protein